MTSVALSASTCLSAMLVSLVPLSVPALAQGTAEERSACIGDAFQFCSSDIPDVPKIEACLIQNMSHLTKGCREEFHRPPEGHTQLTAEHFR